jgi:hypothetical protein
MEPVSVQAEGEKAIRKYAGAGAYLVARSMRIRTARAIVRKWILPYHYMHVAQQMRSRKALAMRYLEAHQQLRAYLKRYNRPAIGPLD